MRFGRPAHRAPITISFQTALIAWLPIAFGIMLGRAMRLAVVVFGGSQSTATGGSTICVGLGAMLAVLLLHGAREGFNWLGVLKISAVWVAVSIVFRAAWIGIAMGGGWTGVRKDYAVRDGQFWPIVLAFIGAAPLILEWWKPKPSNPIAPPADK